MKISNFDDVILELESHLQAYLESQGIAVDKGLFCCINPEHVDSHPSCGIVPQNPNLFHCFSCGISGGIFKAAHFLESKPQAGPEFIHETLIPLAKQFDIEVQSTPLTEDELYVLDTYRGYRLAHDLVISGNISEMAKKAIEERGWDMDLCRQYGVGNIPAFKDFRENLRQSFSAQFLDDIDLGRKDIFDDGHIIFTIKDEHSRPVGFASRNLKYTEDKTNGAKYVNQKTTGAKCNIYRKSTRLFGFDQIVKSHIKKSEYIYIFEGYGDVLTGAKHGLVNCVAIGGTSFSVDQLQLLKDHGYYNLVICLDGDEAGQKRIVDILDNTLAGHKDVRVNIVCIPDSKDPDDYIKEFGLDEFKKLKMWTAFEWRLLQHSETQDGEAICKSMIPLIVNEPSAVVQEKMIKALSLQTGVTAKAILSDVGKIQNSKEAEKARARQNIIDKMARSLQKSPDDAEMLLHEATTSLYTLSKQTQEDSFSEDAFIAALDTQKESEENKKANSSGYILGPDLVELEQALKGEWKEDIWFCLGGKANTGKTALLVKLAYEISRRPENNALVIFHSIDDTGQQIIPRLVCVAEGSKKLTINEVRDPHGYKGKKDLMKRRETGYSIIRNLAKSGKLVLKDSNNGTSLAYANMLISYYKEKYPERHIVYILDNFHKLQDFKGLDERVRFKTMSTEMKNLATRHHIAVLSTVEYTKLARGEKPNNNNIGESGQIEYDANLICHLYNDLHEWADGANQFHLDQNSDTIGGKKLPRIEAIIGKNKISGKKGSIWFDFYPESSDWTFVSEEEVIKIEQGHSSKKAFSSQSKGTHYFNVEQMEQ